MRDLLFIATLWLSCSLCSAQTSDSLIVNQLRGKGIRFSHDNSVTLLMSGQEKFDDMFQAIRQAKHSVHLEYFNFRNDSIAGLLFDLLGEKVKEGVKVRALYDGFGNASNNQPLRKKHLKKIRNMGIEIYEYKPMKFPWVHGVFNRDHRKIVVIDGQIAYTGGMNVADYYIKGTKVVGEWHDMHCRIDGSEVNTLQKIFLKMWNKVSGQNIYGAEYYRAAKKDYLVENLKPDTTATAYHKMVGIINREPHISKDIIQICEGFLRIGRKQAVIKARRKREEKPVEETVEESKVETPVKEEVKPEKKTEKKPAKEHSHTKKNVREEKPEVKSEPKKEVELAKVEPQTIETCEKFIYDVMNAMGMDDVKVTSVVDEEGALSINMEGSNMGILIGKRGQTLDSLQYLTNRVANKMQDGYVRVKLDTEDYRRRRKETLENLAKNIASKVKRTRKTVSLEPMNPYERRIIHSALQSDPAVSTHSEGEEPYRRVVVTLVRNRNNR